jgi:hypothetical protein
MLRNRLPKVYLGAADLATEAEHLAGEEPPHETDSVGGLGVARDGDVDVLHGRVSVAEGDDGDVDVRRLGDGLRFAKRHECQQSYAANMPYAPQHI